MIRVQDPEKSIEFYKKAFGFKLTRTIEKPEGKFNLYYLTDDAENFELELTYNYGHGPYDLGNGYGHLAITVPNLEESWETHTKMGLNPRPLSGLDKSKPNYYFMADPDGYQIEVMREKQID